MAMRRAVLVVASVSVVTYDGMSALVKPTFTSLLGDVERIVVIVSVVVLDGDVSALVEQGHDGGHVLGGSIKLAFVGFHTCDVGRHGAVLAHHVDEVGRRARAEPVST